MQYLPAAPALVSQRSVCLSVLVHAFVSHHGSIRAGPLRHAPLRLVFLLVASPPGVDVDVDVDVEIMMLKPRCEADGQYCHYSPRVKSGPKPLSVRKPRPPSPLPTTAPASTTSATASAPAAAAVRRIRPAQGAAPPVSLNVAWRDACGFVLFLPWVPTAVSPLHLRLHFVRNYRAVNTACKGRR